jgi:glycerol uptake facilitator-like aquaporin
VIPPFTIGMKKYIAEGVGAFALSFAVLLGVSVGSAVPIAIPVIAGLTLGLFVYTIGSISGSHINPAVTLGVLSLKKISTRDATGYIVFQLAGGILALIIGTLVFHVSLNVSFTQTSTLIAFLAETIGTFFFTFGIASVVYEKTPRDTSGWVIGGSLLLGAIIASFAGSAGVLNPAVALALMLTAHSFSWVYIIAPIVGSYLGMQTYKAISK